MNVYSPGPASITIAPLGGFQSVPLSHFVALVGRVSSYELIVTNPGHLTAVQVSATPPGSGGGEVLGAGWRAVHPTYPTAVAPIAHRFGQGRHHLRWPAKFQKQAST